MRAALVQRVGRLEAVASKGLGRIDLSGMTDAQLDDLEAIRFKLDGGIAICDLPDADLQLLASVRIVEHETA